MSWHTWANWQYLCGEAFDFPQPSNSHEVTA